MVGPELKLHQCGLPKKMALELFKPFVMRQLVEKGFAHNIKSAKRVVERVRPEVWDVLEDVIKDHPVLLNRAPTLHRLGIQAFMPVLVEGSAIQIHPLVCTAFNADFDGDQMAVHVPLSTAAQEEARTMMLSTANLLSPADGSPVVAPTQDMVLGCFYLTIERDLPGAGTRAPRKFAGEDEAVLAYQLRTITLHEPVDAEVLTWEANAGAEAEGRLVPTRVRTTVGRIIFNQVLPAPLRFKNIDMKRSALKELVDDCYRLLGPEETAHLVDGIKDVGFEFATRGGMTIAVSDITMPSDKADRLRGADEQVDQIDRQFQRGLITDDERYEQVVGVWQKTTSEMSDAMMDNLDPFGAVTMMTTSGARGNKGNIGQLGAMRGLMADPSGRIIDVPVRSNFREGMRRSSSTSSPPPRRPQGPRRHRTPHGRLGLPHPAPRRRGAGRDHARGRLRGNPGWLPGSRARSRARSPRTSGAPSSAGSSGGSFRQRSRIRPDQTARSSWSGTPRSPRKSPARSTTRASTRCWSARR